MIRSNFVYDDDRSISSATRLISTVAANVFVLLSSKFVLNGGFFSDGGHKAAQTRPWISDTRFATNVFHLEGWPRIHAKTISESDHIIILLMDRISPICFANCAPSNAAHSSNLATVIFLTGATRVFETIKFVVMLPSFCCDRKYIAAT